MKTRSDFGVTHGSIHPSSGARAGDASVGKRTLVQLLEAAVPASAAVRGPGRDGSPGDAQRVADQGLTGAAQPLPHLDRIQAMFGRHDVRGVRAHVGGAASEAAAAMGAEAYATGASVAFAQTPDLHTAAHEAAHVVQQRAGVHLAGGVGQAGDEHERHADAVADRVVEGRSAEDLLDAYAGGGGGRAVQHRKIGAEVYERYDPEAARAPTREMIEAGLREDTAESLRVEAESHQATIASLATDPMFGAKAAAQLDAMTLEVASVTRAKKLITISIDLIVKAYGEALDDELIKRCTPKSQKRDDRLAAIKAKQEQDERIKAKIDGLVRRTSDELDGAKQATARIRSTAALLTAEAERQRQGQKEYQRNVSARHKSNENNVPGRAENLGIEVPDVEPIFAQARSYGEANEWVKAGSRSGEGRSQLEALEREVKNAERDQDAYERLQGELRELKQIEESFEELKIQRGPLQDVKDLVTEARAAHAGKQWRQARSLAQQAADRLPGLTDLVAKFHAYRNGASPKLLLGTILAVHDELARGGAYSNEQALTALEATYRNQCAVTRLNWLQHLNIAGDNVKIGSDSDHYTTFNNSIPAFATLRVDVDEVDALCDQLFGAVATNLQIHATRVVGGTRYHRYWDGNYSQNVQTDDLANTNPTAYAQLDTRYDAMVRDMTEGVRKAKTAHGRVSANQLGHQITITLV